MISLKSVKNSLPKAKTPLFFASYKEIIGIIVVADVIKTNQSSSYIRIKKHGHRCNHANG